VSLKVTNLHKRFGEQVVLAGLNLEVKTGESVAIVGPSGVGKSVLLKMIMGIMEPDQGSVYVMDQEMSALESEADKNALRANLGVLFQSAALFDSLTVYENIAFPMQQRTSLRVEEIHQRVLSILEALSLSKYHDRLPQELPMGTRKCVGMARALVMEPKIFLFDEPNTGLDPLAGQEVYDVINDCRKRWGFTGLVISHEIPEVFQVVDRVALLLHGRIVFDGSPADFKNSNDPAIVQFLAGNTDGPIQIN
jgi:phospholipid/cholesterol/gamma-HCH transport system ATP-binding protein